MTSLYIRLVIVIQASGVGAVLSQEDESGEHPVGYFSCKLLPWEEQNATTEKECLAIKLAVGAFRVDLMGRPFIAKTDHQALEWSGKMTRGNIARLNHWSLALQHYHFQVRYRPGKTNANADAVSSNAHQWHNKQLYRWRRGREFDGRKVT